MLDIEWWKGACNFEIPHDGLDISFPVPSGSCMFLPHLK